MLVNQIDAWTEKNQLSGVKPEDIALKLWAISIGTSHMAINYDLERYVTELDVDDVVRTSAQAFLSGVIEEQKRTTG